jgi:hypothetical protein
MHRLVLLLALIACQAKQETPASDSATVPPVTQSTPPAATGNIAAGSCGENVIRDEGIGDLRIGATVESVRQKCTVVRDTTVPGAEGMPSRRLSVAFPQDTVQAEIVDGRVWRISVRSQRPRTADALGVGTSIGRLRQPEGAHGMTGEGAFFVALPEHCGMSFRIVNGGPETKRGDLDRAGLFRVSELAAVSEVLIFGCNSAPGSAGH